MGFLRFGDFWSLGFWFRLLGFGVDGGLRVGFRVYAFALSCKDALGLNRVSISFCCVLPFIGFARHRRKSSGLLVAEM